VHAAFSLPLCLSLPLLSPPHSSLLSSLQWKQVKNLPFEGF
jgi:hypothetical protein